MNLSDIYKLKTRENKSSHMVDILAKGAYSFFPIFCLWNWKPEFAEKRMLLINWCHSLIISIRSTMVWIHQTTAGNNKCIAQLYKS